jgi:hypothetical protein
MKKQSEIFVRVNAIAEYLEKGETTGEVLKEFMGRWNISKRTVEGYLAMAKEQLSDRNKTKQEVMELVRKDAIAKAQEQIISDIELEAQLCAIIKGELELEKKISHDGVEKVIKYKPTHFDIILAIDKLWKKRGSYPVEKKQVENQTLVLQYNLQKPEDIKYIEGV